MADKPRGPSLDLLETFLAVAELGSQTAAGRQLGCNQSTINRRITSLEDWLRTLLFTGDTLTEAGQKFLPVAKQVLTLMNEARQVIPEEISPEPARVSGRDLRL